MKNLRKTRKEYGESMRALGEAVGVSESAISQYETGKRQPDFETLLKISERYNTSIDYLLRNDGGDSAVSANAVRINVYGSVPAGVPIEAIEDVVDWEDIPREWTRGDQQYFGLKVKGNSMFPKYIDGDTVIVRLQPNCESGQDCVVYVNGYDATLKKVAKLPDGILLQPLNPDHLPRQYDYNDEINPVTIVGVVVEIRRKV